MTLILTRCPRCGAPVDVELPADTAWIPCPAACGAQYRSPDRWAPTLEWAGVTVTPADGVTTGD